jgi:hypothetical protein
MSLFESHAAADAGLLADAVHVDDAESRTILARVLNEAPLIIACACVAILWLTNLGVQVAADSWLNLLGGREILRHGIPHHDALAVFSHGRTWIDQQWLANLAYYGLYLGGGVGLAARANVLIFVATLALVFVIGRRRGVTRLSLMVCCIPMCVVGLEFIRAQVLVEPMFVLLVALLASESRRPSRRILFAFPMLALWANLHGSVIVATVLVALLGLTEGAAAVRGRLYGPPLLRAVALLAAPWPLVFASPYGASLVHYYNTTLRNPVFAKYLTEWAAPVPLSIWGVPLLALGGAIVFLVARHPRGWTAWEKAAIAFTLVGGVLAVRSIPWFTLAGAVLLPSLLDRERRVSRKTEGAGGRPTLALAGIVLAGALVVHGLARPGNSIALDWPEAGAAKVSAILRADPSARVLATYELADWILFQVPEARGRIAFDGRWEILPPSEFRTIMNLHGERTSGWERPARGYRVLVIDPQGESGLVRTLERRPGTRVRFRSPRVVVLDRGRPADLKP